MKYSIKVNLTFIALISHIQINIINNKAEVCMKKRHPDKDDFLLSAVSGNSRHLKREHRHSMERLFEGKEWKMAWATGIRFFNIQSFSQLGQPSTLTLWKCVEVLRNGLMPYLSSGHCNHLPSHPWQESSSMPLEWLIQDPEQPPLPADAMYTGLPQHWLMGEKKEKKIILK